MHYFSTSVQYVIVNSRATSYSNSDISVKVFGKQTDMLLQ